MPKIADLPQLAILPVEDLVLHEFHDEQRTPPLIEKLQQSGVLRNPPVVMPLKSGSGRFMVLDGANRVSAFKRSGIPHILVQVIDLDDPNLELNAWNHVLWGVSPDELYNALRKIPGVMMHPSTQSLSFKNLMDIHTLASIHLPNGKVFTAFTNSVDLIGRIKALNAVVAGYFEISKIDRTTNYRVQSLLEVYEDLGGLVMLPPFTVPDVMDVVKSGYLMPPGSTRFTISPRALHVNYELRTLMSERSLDEKNQDLQDWLSHKLALKCVRRYQEPTILFDE